MDFDGIFIMQDLGIITPMIPLLKGMKDAKKLANKKQFKSIFYFPVDCELPGKEFEGLEFFDLLVTYTEYGRKQVVEHNQTLRDSIIVIPHGVSGSDYHKIPDEENLSFRRKYFNDPLNELYIIGSINRNQPRKDIPATIFGFMEAKKTWNNPKRPFLYLHMEPKDAKGWNLPYLLEQCGLVEGYDYMFPKSDDIHYQVDVQTMNRIYNAIDVYISTSRGEGWGLTATEAMAVGKLCILPYHTSYMEIGKTRCIFLEEMLPVCGIDDNVIRDACFYIEVAEKIIESYDLIYAQEKGHQMMKRSIEYMQNLRWNSICLEWIKVFKSHYKIR
jgi:glycosyltransferase involved in cell wall biosynthesis